MTKAGEVGGAGLGGLLCKLEKAVPIMVRKRDWRKSGLEKGRPGRGLLVMPHGELMAA